MGDRPLHDRCTTTRSALSSDTTAGKASRSMVCDARGVGATDTSGMLFDGSRTGRQEAVWTDAMVAAGSATRLTARSGAAQAITPSIDAIMRMVTVPRRFTSRATPNDLTRPA